MRTSEADASELRSFNSHFFVQPLLDEILCCSEDRYCDWIYWKEWIGSACPAHEHLRVFLLPSHRSIDLLAFHLVTLTHLVLSMCSKRCSVISNSAREALSSSATINRPIFETLEEEHQGAFFMHAHLYGEHFVCCCWHVVGQI